MTKPENPFLILTDAEFQRRLAEMISVHPTSKEVGELVEAVRGTFDDFDLDWYMRDYRSTTPPKVIEQILKDSEALIRKFSEVGDLTLKSLRENGIENGLYRGPDESDEEYERRQNMLIDINFPNATHHLHRLMGGLHRLLTDGIENRQRPTKQAAEILYENIFSIFLQFYPYKGDEGDLLAEEHVEAMIEFADFVLTSVHFPHPGVGESLGERSYDGKFSRKARTYFYERFPKDT